MLNGCFPAQAKCTHLLNTFQSFINYKLAIHIKTNKPTKKSEDDINAIRSKLEAFNVEVHRYLFKNSSKRRKGRPRKTGWNK